MSNYFFLHLISLSVMGCWARGPQNRENPHSYRLGEGRGKQSRAIEHYFAYLKTCWCFSNAKELCLLRTREMGMALTCDVAGGPCFTCERGLEVAPTSLGPACLDQQWQPRKAEDLKLPAGVTQCGRKWKWGYGGRSTLEFKPKCRAAVGLLTTQFREEQKSRM